MSGRTIMRIGRRLALFGRDRRGATAIEYALIAVGIAVAVAGTVFTLGSQLNTAYFEEITKAFL